MHEGMHVFIENGEAMQKDRGGRGSVGAGGAAALPPPPADFALAQRAALPTSPSAPQKAERSDTLVSDTSPKRPSPSTFPP